MVNEFSTGGADKPYDFYNDPSYIGKPTEEELGKKKGTVPSSLPRRPDTTIGSPLPTDDIRNELPWGGKREGPHIDVPFTFIHINAKKPLDPRISNRFIELALTNLTVGANGESKRLFEISDDERDKLFINNEAAKFKYFVVKNLASYTSVLDEKLIKEVAKRVASKIEMYDKSSISEYCKELNGYLKQAKRECSQKNGNEVY